MRTTLRDRLGREPAIARSWVSTPLTDLMRIPRPRFTLRWMMVAVAIVGVELGCGLFFRREFRQPDGRLDWWSAMILQLVYLNLWIVVPACIFACLLHHWRLIPKPTKDR
jgi:hypothetical protein